MYLKKQYNVYIIIKRTTVLLILKDMTNTVRGLRNLHLAKQLYYAILRENLTKEEDTCALMQKN